jgi:membrane protein implicated in regulation of membrane protease activity
MTWWWWTLLGLGLLLVEIVTPGGLFALFFGVAAVLVGALVALGMGGPAWFQWLLFSALSLVLLVTVRRRLRGALGGPAGPIDSMIGEAAVLLDDLAPGGVGRAELRGTTWEARSRAPDPLARGRRCKVERVEGLTLWLTPE